MKQLETSTHQQQWKDWAGLQNESEIYFLIKDWIHKSIKCKHPVSLSLKSYIETITTSDSATDSWGNLH